MLPQTKQCFELTSTWRRLAGPNKKTEAKTLKLQGKRVNRVQNQSRKLQQGLSASTHGTHPICVHRHARTKDRPSASTEPFHKHRATARMLSGHCLGTPRPFGKALAAKAPTAKISHDLNPLQNQNNHRRAPTAGAPGQPLELCSVERTPTVLCTTGQPQVFHVDA